MGKRFFKTTAWITLIAFGYSSILHQPLYALAREVKDSRAVGEMREQSQDLLFPFRFGRITGGYGAGTDELVVYIQDLHCNAEVQGNIYHILNYFDGKYPVTRVFLEGAPAGKLEGSLLALMPGDEMRQRVADNLLAKGLLSGPEYFAFKERKDNLYGLEEWQSYRENLTRIKDLIARKPAHALTVQRLESALAETGGYRLSPRVQRLQRETAGGQKYPKLEYYGRRMGEDPGAYPHLSAYLEMLRLGKRISYKRLPGELRECTRDLRSVLPFNVYRDLNEKLNNKDELENYYASLAALAPRYLPDIARRYPDLNGYFEYIRLNQQLNPLYLASEEKFFRDRLLQRAAKTLVERDLLFLDEMSDCLRSFAELRITPEEYEYFSAHRSRYGALLQKYLAEETDIVRDALALMNDPELHAFYRTNVKRTGYFAGNVARALDEGRNTGNGALGGGAEKVCANLGQFRRIDVVVGGGFHSDISRTFEKSGISYLIVTPNAVQGSDGKLYEKVMRGAIGIHDVLNSGISNPKAFVQSVLVRLGTEEQLPYVQELALSVLTNAQAGAPGTPSLPDFFSEFDAALAQNGINVGVELAPRGEGDEYRLTVGVRNGRQRGDRQYVFRQDKSGVRDVAELRWEKGRWIDASDSTRNVSGVSRRAMARLAVIMPLCLSIALALSPVVFFPQFSQVAFVLMPVAFVTGIFLSTPMAAYFGRHAYEIQKAARTVRGLRRHRSASDDPEIYVPLPDIGRYVHSPRIAQAIRLLIEEQGVYEGIRAIPPGSLPGVPLRNETIRGRRYLGINYGLVNNLPERAVLEMLNNKALHARFSKTFPGRLLAAVPYFGEKIETILVSLKEYRGTVKTKIAPPAARTENAPAHDVPQEKSTPSRRQPLSRVLRSINSRSPSSFRTMAYEPSTGLWKESHLKQWEDAGLESQIDGIVLPDDEAERQTLMYRRDEGASTDHNIVVMFDLGTEAKDDTYQEMVLRLASDGRIMAAIPLMNIDLKETGGFWRTILRAPFMVIQIFLPVARYFSLAVSMIMALFGNKKATISAFQVGEYINTTYLRWVMSRLRSSANIKGEGAVKVDPKLTVKGWLLQRLRWWGGIQDVMIDIITRRRPQYDAEPRSLRQWNNWVKTHPVYSDPQNGTGWLQDDSIPEWLKTYENAVEPEEIAYLEGGSSRIIDIVPLGNVTQKDVSIGGKPTGVVTMAVVPDGVIIITRAGEKVKVVMPARLSKGVKFNTALQLWEGRIGLMLDGELYNGSNIVRFPAGQGVRAAFWTPYPPAMKEADDARDRIVQEEKRTALRIYHDLVARRRGTSLKGISLPGDVGQEIKPGRTTRFFSWLTGGKLDFMLYTRFRFFFGKIFRGQYIYATLQGYYRHKDVIARIDDVMSNAKHAGRKDLRETYASYRNIYEGLCGELGNAVEVNDLLGLPADADRDSAIRTIGLMSAAGNAMALGDPVAGRLFAGNKRTHTLGDAVKPFGWYGPGESAVYRRCREAFPDYNQDTTWLWGSMTAMKRGGQRLSSYLLSGIPADAAAAMAKGVPEKIYDVIERAKNDGYRIDRVLYDVRPDGSVALVIVAPSAAHPLDRNAGNIDLDKVAGEKSEETAYDRRLRDFASFVPPDARLSLVVYTPEEYEALKSGEASAALIEKGHAGGIPGFAPDGVDAVASERIRSFEQRGRQSVLLDPAVEYVLQKKRFLSAHPGERFPEFRQWAIDNSYMEPTVDQLNGLYDELSRDWINRLNERLKTRGGKDRFSSYALRTGRIRTGSRDLRLLLELFGTEGQAVDLEDVTRWYSLVGTSLDSPFLGKIILPFKRPWVRNGTVNALLARQRIAEGPPSSCLGPSTLPVESVSLVEDFKCGCDMEAQPLAPIPPACGAIKEGAFEKARRNKKPPVWEALQMLAYEGIMRARRDMRENPRDADILEDLGVTDLNENLLGLDAAAPLGERGSRSLGVLESWYGNGTWQDSRNVVPGLYFKGTANAYREGLRYYKGIKNYDAALNLVRCYAYDSNGTKAVNPRLVASIALTYSAEEIDAELKRLEKERQGVSGKIVAPLPFSPDLKQELAGLLDAVSPVLGKTILAYLKSRTEAEEKDVSELAALLQSFKNDPAFEKGLMMLFGEAVRKRVSARALTEVARDLFTAGSRPGRGSVRFLRLDMDITETGLRDRELKPDGSITARTKIGTITVLGWASVAVMAYFTYSFTLVLLGLQDLDSAGFMMMTVLSMGFFLVWRVFAAVGDLTPLATLCGYWGGGVIGTILMYSKYLAEKAVIKMRLAALFVSAAVRWRMEPAQRSLLKLKAHRGLRSRHAFREGTASGPSRTMPQEGEATQTEERPAVPESLVPGDRWQAVDRFAAEISPGRDENPDGAVSGTSDVRDQVIKGRIIVRNKAALFKMTAIDRSKIDSSTCDIVLSRLHEIARRAQQMYQLNNDSDFTLTIAVAAGNEYRNSWAYPEYLFARNTAVVPLEALLEDDTRRLDENLDLLALVLGRDIVASQAISGRNGIRRAKKLAQTVLSAFSRLDTESRSRVLKALSRLEEAREVKGAGTIQPLRALLEDNAAKLPGASTETGYFAAQKTSPADFVNRQAVRAKWFFTQGAFRMMRRKALTAVLGLIVLITFSSSYAFAMVFSAFSTGQRAPAQTVSVQREPAPSPGSAATEPAAMAVRPSSWEVPASWYVDEGRHGRAPLPGRSLAMPASGTARSSSIAVDARQTYLLQGMIDAKDAAGASKVRVAIEEWRGDGSVSAPSARVTVFEKGDSPVSFAQPYTPTDDQVRAVRVVIEAENTSGKAIYIDGLKMTPYAPRTGPRVVLRFDDGWKNQLEAVKVMGSYGYRGVFNVITRFNAESDFDRADEYMNWDDIRLLQQQGNEIGVHSRTHPENLDGLSPEQVESEVSGSFTDAREHGIEPDSYCAPYYAIGPNAQRLALRDAESVQVYDVPEMPEIINPGYVPVTLVGPSSDVAVAALESAKTNNGVVIMAFHRFVDNPQYDTEMTPGNFRAILDFIHENNIPVVTMHELLAEQEAGPDMIPNGSFEETERVVIVPPADEEQQPEMPMLVFDGRASSLEVTDPAYPLPRDLLTNADRNQDAEKSLYGLHTRLIKTPEYFLPVSCGYYQNIRFSADVRGTLDMQLLAGKPFYVLDADGTIIWQGVLPAQYRKDPVTSERIYDVHIGLDTPGKYRIAIAFDGKSFVSREFRITDDPFSPAASLMANSYANRRTTNFPKFSRTVTYRADTFAPNTTVKGMPPATFDEANTWFYTRVQSKFYNMLLPSLRYLPFAGANRQAITDQADYTFEWMYAMQAHKGKMMGSVAQVEASARLFGVSTPITKTGPRYVYGGGARNFSTVTTSAHSSAMGQYYLLTLQEGNEDKAQRALESQLQGYSFVRKYYRTHTGVADWSPEKSKLERGGYIEDTRDLDERMLASVMLLQSYRQDPARFNEIVSRYGLDIDIGEAVSFVKDNYSQLTVRTFSTPETSNYDMMVARELAFAEKAFVDAYGLADLQKQAREDIVAYGDYLVQTADGNASGLAASEDQRMMWGSNMMLAENAASLLYAHQAYYLLNGQYAPQYTREALDLWNYLAQGTSQDGKGYITGIGIDGGPKKYHDSLFYPGNRHVTDPEKKKGWLMNGPTDYKARGVPGGAVSYYEGYGTYYNTEVCTECNMPATLLINALDGSIRQYYEQFKPQGQDTPVVYLPALPGPAGVGYQVNPVGASVLGPVPVSMAGAQAVVSPSAKGMTETVSLPFGALAVTAALAKKRKRKRHGAGSVPRQNGTDPLLAAQGLVEPALPRPLAFARRLRGVVEDRIAGFRSAPDPLRGTVVLIPASGEGIMQLRHASELADGGLKPVVIFGGAAPLGKAWYELNNLIVPVEGVDVVASAAVEFVTTAKGNEVCGIFLNVIEDPALQTAEGMTLIHTRGGAEVNRLLLDRAPLQITVDMNTGILDPGQDRKSRALKLPKLNPRRTIIEMGDAVARHPDGANDRLSDEPVLREAAYVYAPGDENAVYSPEQVAEGVRAADLVVFDSERSRTGFEERYPQAASLLRYAANTLSGSKRYLQTMADSLARKEIAVPSEEGVEKPRRTFRSAPVDLAVDVAETQAANMSALNDLLDMTGSEISRVHVRLELAGQGVMSQGVLPAEAVDWDRIARDLGTTVAGSPMEKAHACYAKAAGSRRKKAEVRKKIGDFLEKNAFARDHMKAFTVALGISEELGAYMLWSAVSQLEIMRQKANSKGIKLIVSLRLPADCTADDLVRAASCWLLYADGVRLDVNGVPQPIVMNGAEMLRTRLKEQEKTVIFEGVSGEMAKQRGFEALERVEGGTPLTVKAAAVRGNALEIDISAANIGTVEPLLRAAATDGVRVVIRLTASEPVTGGKIVVAKTAADNYFMTGLFSLVGRVMRGVRSENARVWYDLYRDRGNALGEKLARRSAKRRDATREDRMGTNVTVTMQARDGQVFEEKGPWVPVIVAVYERLQRNAADNAQPLAIRYNGNEVAFHELVLVLMRESGLAEKDDTVRCLQGTINDILRDALGRDLPDTVSDAGIAGLFDGLWMHYLFTRSLEEQKQKDAVLTGAFEAILSAA